MPRNGSGTYSLPEAPFVAGSVISSAAVNDDLSDIAAALTGSLPRDGQAGMTGQFTAVDGSILAPSISFNNEDDSGFFLASAGVIGIVIGGTQVGTINSDGVQGTLPIGFVGDFAGGPIAVGGAGTIPPLWYLCYGQAVSRVTYALLFAVIGTTYGSGDGVNTFNLPDLRGRTIYGKSDMGGADAGRITTPFFGSSPNVLGNVGGAQSSQLATNSLPAYTPSGTITVTNGAITVNGTASNNAGGATFQINLGGGIGNYGVASLTASQSTSTATFTGSAQGGTATPFTNLAPGMIMNKIIYAGA